MRNLIRLAALAAGLTIAASGCSLDSTPNSSGNVVNVVIGYQSKTINTVTAGTLLKAQGYLERRLDDITTRTGTKYNVTWQDYDTGAPITAQMVAEKIDIGSMGDYPMLINGSKTQANERARTEIVSVTGYNPKGALNMVVVAPNSPAETLTDLRRPEGVGKRRFGRPRHAGSGAVEGRDRPQAPVSRSSTSSRRSARLRWNPVRCRHFRSSSRGRDCWSSRTRASCSTTVPS